MLKNKLVQAQTEKPREYQRPAIEHDDLQTEIQITGHIVYDILLVVDLLRKHHSANRTRMLMVLFVANLSANYWSVLTGKLRLSQSSETRLIGSPLR